MEAKIIDGKSIAQNIRNDIAIKVRNFINKGYRQPKLSVILVGNDPASHSYVRNKRKACEQCFILSDTHELSENTSKKNIEELILKLNSDPSVDAILLQLPLPKNLQEYENELTALIDPNKDVDGFHPINLGKLSLGIDAPIACTPLGIIKMLDTLKIDLTSKNAVIIGRSNTVGKPLIQLLLKKNCTVTITHSKTKNLKDITRQAEILIVAVGKAQFIKGDMIKDGAIVIDVGINRLENTKLIGDVDFESASQVASYISKVPGGVGPMTVAILMQNTMDLYEKNLKGELD